MLTVRSTINIASQTVPPIIPVVQGDTGRAILFTLADFTIPAGATATYYVQKPSGEAIYNNATIDGNNVLVNLTAQSIIEKGDNYGQVRITVGEEVVTSFDFILLVKEFRGIDAVQSLTEMNIFDKAVEQASEAIDEVKTDALEAIDDAKDEAIEEVTSNFDLKLDASSTKGVQNQVITQAINTVNNAIGDLSGETVTPTATNNYGVGGNVGQVIETWATTEYWHGIYTVSAGNTYGITTVSDFPQQLVVWFTNASNTIIENHKAFATDHVEMVCTAPTGATKLYVMSYGYDAYHGTVQKVEPLSETVSNLKDDFDDALSPVKSLYNLCTGIQKGKAWAGWGGVGTKATISDNSTYMAATIDITGQSYLSLNRAWIGPSFSFFTDDSDTIIKKVSDCYTGTAYVYTVPEGATKALISQNVANNTDIDVYGVVALPVSTTINNYSIEDYPYNGTPSISYFADALKVKSLNSEMVADILANMDTVIQSNTNKANRIQQISAKNRGWTNTGYGDQPNDGAFERVIVKLDPNNDLVFSGASTSNQYFYYLLFYDENGNVITTGKRSNTGNTTDTVEKADFPPNATYAQIIFNRGGLANATITNGTNTQFVPSNTFDILKKISSHTEVGAEIVIPDTITAVVGDTLQIYYDSIVKSTEAVRVQFLGTKGKALERYFEYTPSQSDVGNSSMTINVLKYNNIDSSFSTIVATKTITLKTVAVPSSPASEKHILCVGDSTIVAGDYIKELARRICGTGGTPTGNQFANLKFTGRLKKTIDGITVGYEGFSGWTWNSYISSAIKAIRFYVSGVSSLNFEAVYQDSNGCKYNISEINVTNGTGNIRCIYIMGSATTTPQTSGTLTRISGSGDATITYSSIDVEEFSPFVINGSVDFTDYVDEYCSGTVDYVMFSLGTNVIINSNAEFSTIKSNMLNQMDTLISKLHEQYPSAIVLLCTLQKGSMHGGFGNNFGSAYNANSEFYNHKVYQLNQAYLEFASTRSYVKLVDVSAEFDTLYDYPHTMKAVNTRDATNTEMVDTNFGHPSTIGYMQMADAMYRAFIGVLS